MIERMRITNNIGAIAYNSGTVQITGGLGVSSNIYCNGNINLSPTTSSLPVVTDSSKKLVSLSYSSFKTNLGLTQNDVASLSTSDSPIFAGVSTAALALTGSYKVHTKNQAS